MSLMVTLFWMLTMPVQALKYGVEDVDFAIVLFSSLVFFSHWCSIDSFMKSEEAIGMYMKEKHLSAKFSSDIVTIITSIFLAIIFAMKSIS
jgi:hypothetical protein